MSSGTLLCAESGVWWASVQIGPGARLKEVRCLMVAEKYVQIKAINCINKYNLLHKKGQ